MNGAVDPIQMRSVLLDALEALAEHAPSVIVIGAQGVYLWTGSTPIALAESTKDIDLALDSRSLPEDPLLEDAMTSAGFRLNPTVNQPGAWTTPQGIDVDLMVPEALVVERSRRSAKIPPHGQRVARRAVGLEAAVVDNRIQEIGALAPDDRRVITARVASPAALLVAKLHKIGERVAEQGRRRQDKDAHDVYRLLYAIPTHDFVESWRRLTSDDLSAGVTSDALTYLEELFAAGPGATGSLMAGRAEEGVGDPEQVAASVAILANDICLAVALS